VFDEKQVKSSIRELLDALGCTGDEFEDTPRRIVDMYKRCFKGFEEDPKKYLERTIPTKNQEMVVVKDIEFFSLWPHHLLPYFGSVHIAYVPNKKLLGISKFHSLVECVAAKPQLQEELTSELADLIWESLEPMGVMVVIEALHTCTFIRGRYDYSMMSRTSQKTITSALRGVFAWHATPRMEALMLFKGGEKNAI